MATAADNTTVRIEVEKVKDDEEVQGIQAKGRTDQRFGKDAKHIPRFQNYGFTSNVPAGSQGIATAFSGNPDQLFAQFLDSIQHRPKGLGTGEWKLWDMWGGYLHAKQNQWELKKKEVVVECVDYFCMRIGTGEGASRISATPDWVKIRSGDAFVICHKPTGLIIVSGDLVVGGDPDPSK